jgi:hypothetical protein
MTVPMAHYPYFLSNFNSVCYTLLYFSILLGRYKLGIVTWDMLQCVYRQVAVGCCAESKMGFVQIPQVEVHPDRINGLFGKRTWIDWRCTSVRPACCAFAKCAIFLCLQ